MPGFRVETSTDVITVILDKPPLNVLDIALLEDMTAFLRALDSSSFRVLVLRASGKCFSAGVDIRQHLPAEAKAMLAAMRGFLQALWRIEAPVVAVVSGAVLGGAFEIVMACDLVLARDDSTFALPEVKVGAFPPLACAWLPTHLPISRAFDMVACGHQLDALEALRWGFCNEIFDSKEFEDEVARRLSELLALSGAVVRQAKKALCQMDREAALQRLALLEQQYLNELLTLGDASEGLHAFLEKRPPIWQHK